jgi:hypothetical protein
MTKHKTATCSVCRRKLNADSDCFYTLEGKEACLSCWEREFEGASKLVKFSPNKTEHFLLTKHFGVTGKGDMILTGYPEPIKTQSWKKVDGWRARTEWKYLPEFLEIVSGWVTNIPDEFCQRKKELISFFQTLESRKLTPPCTLYWIIGATSNAFSSSSAIILNRKDVEKIEKWLDKELNLDIKLLQTMFA